MVAADTSTVTKRFLPVTVVTPTPLLDIPLIGRLFGQKKQRNSDYEIWIMIRPSILKK